MSNNIEQKIDKDQKARIANLTNERAIMLKTLARAGVQEINGYYESCGNTTISKIDPQNANLSENDEKHLEAFVWDFANAIDPFLENNEASGLFEWDISNDRINISHTILKPRELAFTNL